MAVPPVPADRDLVSRTLDLLSYDTRNPPGETRDATEYVADLASARGLETAWYTVDPAKPNLLVTVPGDSAATLLYNGHLDTVPFEEAEWAHDPLGEREDDRIYGRGATDMKGPAAAMVETMLAWAEAAERPPLTLQFAFVSDEETGGDAGTDALVDLAPLEAVGCVIGETTCEAGRHSVTVADKGSMWLTLDAEGEAAHGSRPMLGTNAIDRLYRAVEQVRGLLCEYEFELEPAVEDIVAESVEYYAGTMGREAAETLFAHPTCNLGTIEGGESINTVPASARATLDLRLSPGVDTPALLAAVRERVDGVPGVTITDVSYSVGSYVPVDAPIVESVVATAEAAADDRIYRRSATGGGDAKTFRTAGIPAVEFAFGTETVHAVDEYTTVTALRRNAEVYLALPAALAERLDGS
jgi:succinyl-diaminopimelate desuccinylase